MSGRKKREGKARKKAADEAKARVEVLRLQRPKGMDEIRQGIRLGFAASKQAAEDEVKALIARSTTEVNEHTTQIVTAEHKGTREFFENAMNDVEQRLRNEIRSMTPQRTFPSAVSIGDASTSVPDINRRESSSYIQTPLRRTSYAPLPTDPAYVAYVNELEEQLRVYKTPAKCSSNFQPEETPVYHSEVSKIDEETRRKVAGRCMEAKKKANMPLSETSRPTTRSRARKQASKL